MSTDVKLGCRIIGEVKHEEDGSWTAIPHYGSVDRGLATKDEAVRTVHDKYKSYLHSSSDLPPDLNWHKMVGVKGREFLCRPDYTKDATIYGQRKIVKE